MTSGGSPYTPSFPIRLISLQPERAGLLQIGPLAFWDQGKAQPWRALTVPAARHHTGESPILWCGNPRSNRSSPLFLGIYVELLEAAQGPAGLHRDGRDERVCTRSVSSAAEVPFGKTPSI